MRGRKGAILSNDFTKSSWNMFQEVFRISIFHDLTLNQPKTVSSFWPQGLEYLFRYTYEKHPQFKRNLRKYLLSEDKYMITEERLPGRTVHTLLYFVFRMNVF